MTTRDDLVLAHKLLEVFSDRRLRGFERYWALVGPVETFCETAKGAAEERLAKVLTAALEEALLRTAPDSVHPDALAMVAEHGLKRSTRKPWRPVSMMVKRRQVSRRK